MGSMKITMPKNNEVTIEKNKKGEQVLVFTPLPPDKREKNFLRVSKFGTIKRISGLGYDVYAYNLNLRLKSLNMEEVTVKQVNDWGRNDRGEIPKEYVDIFCELFYIPKYIFTDSFTKEIEERIDISNIEQEEYAEIFQKEIKLRTLSESPIIFLNLKDTFQVGSFFQFSVKATFSKKMMFLYIATIDSDKNQYLLYPTLKDNAKSNNIITSDEEVFFPKSGKFNIEDSAVGEEELVVILATHRLDLSGVKKGFFKIPESMEHLESKAVRNPLHKEEGTLLWYLDQQEESGTELFKLRKNYLTISEEVKKET
jgi:hypothetical protein